MKEIFDNISDRCSRLTTKSYSTSFYSGISFLDRPIQREVCNIYGFVRFADEIVDTFHGFDKAKILSEFETETYLAIERKISINPILNSFQSTVNKFDIEHKWIELFLQSMKMDLSPQTYSESNFKNYIVGSAEVVGLMCLHVFTNNDKHLFKKLQPHAMLLGSVFQKVNFLRDLSYDFNSLNRTYFPGLSFENLNDQKFKSICEEIENEFKSCKKGIQLLPSGSKFGVYLAYCYYLSLFQKIKKSSWEILKQERIRISNFMKFGIMVKAYIVSKLGAI